MTLSDDPAATPFVIPGGTTLAAGAFLAFDSAQLGFMLDNDGETIELRAVAAGSSALLCWQRPQRRTRHRW